jgi:hypothetical protein
MRVLVLFLAFPPVQTAVQIRAARSGGTKYEQQSPDATKVVPPYPLIQYPLFTAARKKKLKIKEISSS